MASHQYHLSLLMGSSAIDWSDPVVTTEAQGVQSLQVLDNTVLDNTGCACLRVWLGFGYGRREKLALKKLDPML